MAILCGIASKTSLPKNRRNCNVNILGFCNFFEGDDKDRGRITRLVKAARRTMNLKSTGSVTVLVLDNLNVRTISRGLREIATWWTLRVSIVRRWLFTYTGVCRPLAT